MNRFWLSLGFALALSCLATSLAAQAIPPLRQIPACLLDSRLDLVTQRADLFSARQALHARVTAQAAQCGDVEQDTPEAAACLQSRAQLQAEMGAHARQSLVFNASVPADCAAAPSAPVVKVYRPSGNALIGGTTWITGYNAQSADPALIARAHAMMREQMRLAGLPYDEAVDFDRYNFVLGIAASTDAVTDLASRVVFDEYRNGQYSAQNQAAYDSLKGRAFGELACHSNGAMICLAALANKDITAERVVLYGPQVTVESLKMWDEMVRSGQVKSVQVYWNKGDPVAPLSMAISRGGGLSASLASTVALFEPASLTRVINETAPRVTVRTFPCATRPSLGCHEMAAYESNIQKVGCHERSSGTIVPGTSIPGRPGSGLREPPAPC